MKTTSKILPEPFLKRQKEKDLLLTGISLKHFIFLIILTVAVACQPSDQRKLLSGEVFGKIIYDTSIANHDSTDTWADECLSDFKRKELIEKIFEDIYNGKLGIIDKSNGFFTLDFFKWTKVMVYLSVQFTLYLKCYYLRFVKLNGSKLCWIATCQGYI